MDGKALRNYRINSKRLESIEMPNARAIALYLMDKNPDGNALSDEQIETAVYIKQLINDENLNEGAIASAILKGKNILEETYDFFLEMGYSEREVANFYKRNSDILCFTVKDVEEQYKYLQSINLSETQIRKVFLKSVCLGKNELKKRCDCVLNYFTLKMLLHLAENYLFYRFYTDPVDCIEYMVEKVGVEKAQKILEKEEMILYLWKEEWQRNDWTHGRQHKEALEIISKY